MVEAHKELFITKGEPLGWARVGEHHIRTVDTIPVAQPYRRIIPTEVESVKNQIDEWYQEGIIVKSNSEYASPLVVIKKGNNELRLCVDYRNLNKKTVRDAYPIPRIDDSLEALKGAKICSCFDLKSAYNQINVNKSDQHKTAFNSPWGLYEFTRMPFGLVYAPATFQKIMSNILRDEIFKYVICYLDDILVY